MQLQSLTLGIQVSESAAQNQMNVENLAVVFAPTLFRDDAPPSAQANRKKRGSQVLDANIRDRCLRFGVSRTVCSTRFFRRTSCARRSLSCSSSTHTCWVHSADLATNK